MPQGAVQLFTEFSARPGQRIKGCVKCAGIPPSALTGQGAALCKGSQSAGDDGNQADASVQLRLNAVDFH